MASFDLWNNLVYVVFANPFLFAIVILSMVAYYSIIYDLSWWVFALFSTLFLTWLSYVLVGEWMFILIAISIAFFLAVQIFRKLRN